MLRSASGCTAFEHDDHDARGDGCQQCQVEASAGRRIRLEDDGEPTAPPPVSGTAECEGFRRGRRLLHAPILGWSWRKSSIQVALTRERQHESPGLQHQGLRVCRARWAARGAEGPPGSGEPRRAVCKAGDVREADFRSQTLTSKGCPPWPPSVSSPATVDGTGINQALRSTCIHERATVGKPPFLCSSRVSSNRHRSDSPAGRNKRPELSLHRSRLGRLRPTHRVPPPEVLIEHRSLNMRPAMANEI